MSTLSQRLIKAIKTDLHFKEDMICFDMHRWSIKKLVDYIILRRKEIGLFKKSDFEIDEKWIAYKIFLYMGMDKEGVDTLAKAIVKKNPIKIKGEK